MRLPHRARSSRCATIAGESACRRCHGVPRLVVSTLHSMPPVPVASSRPPVDGVLGAIGDTPLVAMSRYLGDLPVQVWAKLEAANPGGSAKDRPAARMLGDALERGADRAGHDRHRVDVGQHGRRARAGLPLPRHAADLRGRRACARHQRPHDASPRGRRARGLAPGPGDRRPARGAARARPPSAGRDARCVVAEPVRQPVQPGRPRRRHDARDRRGARGRPRLPLRRDEHDRDAARVLRLPARSRARDDGRGRRCRRQRAVRRDARRARAAGLRRGRRDGAVALVALRRARAGVGPRLRHRVQAAGRARGDLRGRVFRRGRGRPRVARVADAARKPLRADPARWRSRLPADGLRRRVGGGNAWLLARRARGARRADPPQPMPAAV